jgi:subtilisin family serine protease
MVERGAVRRLGFILLVVAAASSRTAADSVPVIRWRTGAVNAEAHTDSHFAETLSAVSAKVGIDHVVVQFGGPVGPLERSRLQAAGLQLLSYLGDHAFFASVSASALDVDELTHGHALLFALPVDAGWKLHPLLAEPVLPEWAVVPWASEGNGEGPPALALYVLFHRDVPLDPTCVDTVGAHGARVRSRLESVNGLVVEVPFTGLRALAKEDVVQWMEPALPRMSELNDSNRQRTGADVAQAAPYGLDGSGVTVLVYDTGTARFTHVDFGGRLVAGDTSGIAGHATHVSCTVAGSGLASGGLYRGMAPGATVYSYGFDYDGSGIFLYTNPGDLEDDYDEAINAYGADIANNSIGTNTCANGFPCGITGDYGVTSALIDAIVGGSLGAPFRVVWANGNERGCHACPNEHENGYHSTAPPACAKNHITVGALHSNDDSLTGFTSWGPADDGRIKPDLAAPGCQRDDDRGVTSCSGLTDTAYASACGTSMAAPTVTGLAALLLQDFRARYPGRPDPAGATVKALFVHNAHDLDPPGPDYKAGFGSVRVVPTIDFMRSGHFFEATVDQGASYAALVGVTPEDALLKVTLAWDDVPGTPNVTPALVNDLDVRVRDPEGVLYYPWTLDPTAPSAPATATRADHVNNIEQVLVEAPTPGVWHIEVFAYDVPEGPQAFSLCASPRLASDCNDNGILDYDEILADPALDCAGNGTLDECEPDCDADGIVDSCEIFTGAAGDCNFNGVPDDCESADDCNHNGVQDICDLAAGTSADCNRNRVPDECDITDGTSGDCNTNAVPDECEPYADCNENGVQDICDIAAGTASDCNTNMVPDDCELFDCGPPVGDCPGEGDCCDAFGNATPGCDCAACCHAVCLVDLYCCRVEWDSLCAARALEAPACDCGGAHQHWSYDCNGNGQLDECDIAEGTSGDCNSNGIPDECDPYVDCNSNGVQDICDIGTGTSNDCNGNAIPDECEAPDDCNDNGLQDICDLATGASPDCNANAVPDECDLADGTSEDCNTNLVPDECESESDCNGNGVPDVCDVWAGTSPDCNGNLLPDECDIFDCGPSVGSCPGYGSCCEMSGNGTPGCECASCCAAVCAFDPTCCTQAWDSWCAFAAYYMVECDCGAPWQPWSTDCNENGVPDECDIAAGVSDDCNGNALPDECDPARDCNGNGVQDVCDVASGLSLDCNQDEVPDECQVDCNRNDVPDDCDIGSGVSGDCDFNGTPDECDVYGDCNENGIQDICDVAGLESADCDKNRVPDECEPDCNQNGVTDACDVVDADAGGEDHCYRANPLCPGRSYEGTTVGLTNDGSSGCGSSETSPDAWYRYTPVEDGVLHVWLCGSLFDTVLSVHTGCPGTVATEVACNDDWCGWQSELWVDVTGGETYWVRIAGYLGGLGHFSLGLSGPESSVPCEAVSTDCDGDAIPDECGAYADCNANGVRDICDVAWGLSGDCNWNRVPDECEPAEDCNGNGVQDICDVYSCGAPSGVCPGEGDCCEPEGNGSPGCDCARCCRAVCRTHPGCCTADYGWRSDCAAVAALLADCNCGGGAVWSPDCNGNGIPDECDVQGDGGSDCNGNGIPDECELDQDADGTIDDCDGCPADGGKVGAGQCGCGQPDVDTDGDGQADCVDPDDDNDGVSDDEDADALNPSVCVDADGDRCDDCAVGTDGFGPLADNDTMNDGPDANGDGICDAGAVPATSWWGLVTLALAMLATGKAWARVHGAGRNTSP